MKKKLVLVSSIVTLAIVFMANTQNQSSAPTARTGSPGDGADCRGCHSGPATQTLTGIISSNIPGSGYVPGTTYTITAAFSRKGHSRFGFEMAAQNATGTALGTLVSAGSGAQLIPAFGTSKNKFVTHTSAGTSATNSITWTATWTAPAKGTGDVTFYGAFLAANNNGNDSGDSTFVSTLTVSESISTGSSDISNENILAFVYPNPVKEKINVQLDIINPGTVNINVYDLSGNLAQHLSSEYKGSGSYSLSYYLDASLAKGIYLLKIEQEEKMMVQKLMVE